ncbi:hypothetical protein VO68_06595 [Aeromonas salmonicida]|nr:hypothetical protein VO68_06595 [Aeromonas salmonicida]
MFVEFLENSKLEKFEFHLYGRGDKSIIEKFINLGGVYHGSYNPADIKLILKDIDIGAVLPLWEDNGPQVVMEFINNGIPVLGTSKGGISDFIITNENGFLFDPDKNKFAAFEWLKSIDKTILSELMNGITPLKTPEQHAKELELEYLKMMDNFN